MNLPAVHRRTMHVLANDAMRLFGGESDVARHLGVVMGHAPGAKAKGSRIHIARLPLKARPVNGAPVQTRRRPGLEPASAQAELLERFAQQNGCGLSRTSRRILLLAAVNQPVQKSSRRNDDHFSRDAPPIAEQNAADDAVVGRWSLVVGNCTAIFIGTRERRTTIDQRPHNHIRHFRLLDLQVRLRLQHLAHLQAVGLFATLRPRRPDGGSARSVEQAELDSDGVRDLAHDAAERIHFAHQMPLRNAADGGITRHLRDQIDVQGIESGLQPHASGRHRGFAPGMAGAHHHHVEVF